MYEVRDARAQCPRCALSAITRQVEAARKRRAKIVDTEIIGAAHAIAVVARRERVVAVMLLVSFGLGPRVEERAPAHRHLCGRGRLLLDGRGRWGSRGSRRGLR